MLRYAWICLNIFKVHSSREAPGGFWEASGGLLRESYLRVLKYVLKVHFFVPGGSGRLLGGFWEASGRLLRESYLQILKYVLKVQCFIPGGSESFWEASGKPLGGSSGRIICQY